MKKTVIGVLLCLLCLMGTGCEVSQKIEWPDVSTTEKLSLLTGGSQVAQDEKEQGSNQEELDVFEENQIAYEFERLVLDQVAEESGIADLKILDVKDDYILIYAKIQESSSIEVEGMSQKNAGIFLYDIDRECIYILYEFDVPVDIESGMILTDNKFLYTYEDSKQVAYLNLIEDNKSYVLDMYDAKDSMSSKAIRLIHAQDAVYAVYDQCRLNLFDGYCLKRIGVNGTVEYCFEETINSEGYVSTGGNSSSWIHIGWQGENQSQLTLIDATNDQEIYHTRMLEGQLDDILTVKDTLLVSMNETANGSVLYQKTPYDSQEKEIEYSLQSPYISMVSDNLGDVLTIDVEGNVFLMCLEDDRMSREIVDLGQENQGKVIGIGSLDDNTFYIQVAEDDKAVFYRLKVG